MTRRYLERGGGKARRGLFEAWIEFDVEQAPAGEPDKETARIPLGTFIDVPELWQTGYERISDDRADAGAEHRVAKAHPGAGAGYAALP